MNDTYDDLIVRCKAFRCLYEGHPRTFRPSPDYAHDFKCPECGSYDIDTSEWHAHLRGSGSEYPYGDYNRRGPMPEEVPLAKAYERGDSDPPNPAGKCFICNSFSAWEEGRSGMTHDGRIVGGETTEPGGTCRFNAPPWPIVSANDWCRKWEVRE